MSAAPEPTPTPAIRARYDIIRQLGAGGMGVVYEALDRNTGRHVALKTMRASRGDSLLRFKTEFRALQDIHHPNLITLGDLFEEEGRWWFSMELVRGTDLLSAVRVAPSAEDATVNPSGAVAALNRTISAEAVAPTEQFAEPFDSYDSGAPAMMNISRGPRVVLAARIDEGRLRALFRQLVEGLHALHLAHKVHRDVKPANILVTDDGRVVILDFGLVGEVLEQESSMIGTIAYMAPEQGARKPVGPAADWYSVGVLLYEALTGQLPFEGDALRVLLDKQLRRPAAPAQLFHEVAPDLSALCMELLRADPAQRPGHAEILLRLTPATVSPIEAATPEASFVGRAPELVILERAFLRTREGRGHTVLLEGESGVGKSALMRRFADSVAEDLSDALVLSGRCYEHESVPFKAVDGVIDSLARALTRMPDATVAEILPSQAAALLQAFPVLGMVPLLGKTNVESAAVVKDQQEQRTRVFTVLRELLGRLAAQRPLLILIDDLQWTDVDSLALLSSIMSPPDEPPLLLLATARPEAQTLQGTWLAVNHANEQTEHLRIGLLSAEDAQTLARRTIGSATELPPAHMQRLLEETAGHPLFIQELLRHAATSELAQVPRLDEVLWARIGGLFESAQRLLRLSALMGSPLRLDVATRASALDPDEVARSLAQLRATHLLRASLRERHDTAQSIDFVEPYHDRIRETVIERLRPEEKRAGHQQLAEALLACGVEDQESLVYHFDGAGQHDKAGEYALQAAEKAAQALAFDRAAGFYAQAISRLKLRGEERRNLLIKQADALAKAGRGHQAAQLLIEAATDADRAQASALHQRAGDQLLISGYYRKGVELIRQAFRDRGLPFFTTGMGVLLSLLAHKIWLSARGLHFQPRAESEISTEELARLDLLRSCTRGLGFFEPLRAAECNTRSLLGALKIGEPTRVARGFLDEAASIMVGGREKEWRRGKQLMEMADALLKNFQQPYTRAYRAYCEGLVQYCVGNRVEAAGLLEEAQRLFQEQCVGATFELATTRQIALYNAQFLGELRRIAASLPAHIQEADARNDLFISSYLFVSQMPLLHLMRDEPESARNESAERLRRLNFPGFGVLHITNVNWKADSFLYESRGEEAYRCRQQEMPRAASLVVRYAQVMRIVDLDMQGRCALAAAQNAGAKRTRLLSVVAKQIRALQQERRMWADALAKNLAACLLYAEGNRSSAATEWRRAAEAFDAANMRIYAATARRRCGQALGGETGRALITAAEQLMQAEGIKRPARWTAMLAPVPLAEI